MMGWLMRAEAVAGATRLPDETTSAVATHGTKKSIGWCEREEQWRLGGALFRQCVAKG